MTLVIMAAGMGSRFGGLKQIEPVGPNGEFIIDYSVYDAIAAGFNEVVFIIKEENYEVFKETIGKRVDDKIKVTYVFQNILDIPIKIDFERIKPWGTGQAILATKDVVKDNFMVINADDFYGRDAFLKIATYLKATDNKSSNFAMAGYQVNNTLGEKGSFKRGICEKQNGYLTNLIESSVEKVGDKFIATPLDGRPLMEVKADTLVSMNAFGFTPALFAYLEEAWLKFFNETKDLEKTEFLIPSILEKMIKEDRCTIKVLETSSIWYGITYPEDKERVMQAIQALIDKQEYKEKLWQ